MKRLVILEINVEHVLSFSEPLLFWLKFPRNHDPETFAKASGNIDWDAAMDEEYRSFTTGFEPEFRHQNLMSFDI